jgi:class 3 adenylate cyclase
MNAPPPTQYARNGDVHLGYQILGSGTTDVVQIGSGVFASVQSFDDEPHAARFIERLTTMCRLIRFDMRGIGMSDPLPQPPRLDDQCDDIIAVLDAVGSERATLYGAAFGASSAMLAAARYPDRVAALILSNPIARFLRADDFPFGRTAEELERTRTAVTQPLEPELATDSTSFIMPSLAESPGFREWWSRAGQQGASPRAAHAQYEPLLTLDLRDQLPNITAPTLVFQSGENWLFEVGHGEYVAQHIPNARYVALPSADRLMFGANAEIVLADIEEFLTGARAGISSNRVLATLLVTDIVGSTRTAAEIGDREWHSRLDQHDAALRAQLQRYGGRVVNTTGDGFLAAFDGAANAVRCAEAMLKASHAQGVAIRAGLHTGECERRGDDLAGLAVHIAARVAALAGANEVYVSRTVRDLVVGSDLRFESRGEHELKGVPESWQIYVLETS